MIASKDESPAPGGIRRNRTISGLVIVFLVRNCRYGFGAVWLEYKTTYSTESGWTPGR